MPSGDVPPRNAFERFYNGLYNLWDTPVTWFRGEERSEGQMRRLHSCSMHACKISRLPNFLRSHIRLTETFKVYVAIALLRCSFPTTALYGRNIGEQANIIDAMP